MMLKNRAILLLPVLICFFLQAAPSHSEPVFRIAFDNGLAPETGQEEGRWTGENPPEYYEHGIRGPALIAGDVDVTGRSPSLNFNAVGGTETSGAMLFWIRGIENWDLYRTVYSKPPGPSVTIASGGWSILRWNYDTAGMKLRAGTVGRDYRQIFYPKFDQYRWTQIGYSWNDKHLRLYLNGSLVAESANFPLNFTAFSLGGGATHDNSRYVFDNLQVWDRPLTNSEVKRLYRHDFRLANKPMVSVPYISSPPVIDGNIDAREWSGAARITGLLEEDTGERAEDQASFYLARDAQYLYIAIQGEMTEVARRSPELVYGRFLNTEGELSENDLVKILISPDYRKTDPVQAGYWTTSGKKLETGTGDTFFITGKPAGWHEYRLISSAADNQRQMLVNSDGADESWTSAWERTSGVSPEGWQIEMRIPLTSFGALPDEGDEWGLQLARVWQHLKQEHNAWSWGSRQANGLERSIYETGQDDTQQATMGTLRFARQDEVTVRVEETGKLEDGLIEWDAALLNPSQDDRRVLVKLFTDTDELSLEKTIDIPSGSSARFASRHIITDTGTSSVTFEVYAPNGILIHRTSIPFYLEVKFGVHIRSYPHYGKFLLDLDLSPFSDIPAEELTVDITMRDGDGNEVLSETGRQIAGHTDSLEYGTANLPEGDYTMAIGIFRKGEIIEQEEKPFTQAGRAVWWDNRHGYDDMELDKVPYPWTDMAVEEDTVRVWGREYRFGNRLLPEQVTSLGRPLLRAPMRIVIRTAGGEEVDTSITGAETEWTKRNRTRVEGVRRVEGSSLSLVNSFWSEYDGLVWNRLTIEPGDGVEIEHMVLEIPLTREFTDIINPLQYSLRETGKLKDEGYVSGAAWPLWLGNGDGGIQWFCETNGQFFLENPSGALKVEMEDGKATLRVTMIDRPTGFRETHDMEFGFIATPVRPNLKRTPYFRQSSVTGGGPWYPKGLEVMPAADPGRNFYHSGRIYVHLNPVNTGADASGTHDFRDYGYEWMQSPDFRYTNEHTVQPTQASKSYRDYFVWRHWRYQQKYGYAGLYYDGFAPLTSANATVGAGYTDRDGNVHSLIPLLGARDVVKRLYNITLSNGRFGAREQAIGIHQSAQPNMALAGFCSYHWDAENYNSRINANQPTYIGFTDTNLYRAQHMGYNQHGLPTNFLGQGRIREEGLEPNGGPEAVFDHIYGLNLLHDGNGVCCIMPRGSVTGEVQTRRVSDVSTLNLHHWKYQFTPYWRQDIIKLPSEDMYASFYIARPSTLLPISSSSLLRSHAYASYFNGYEHIPGYMRGTLDFDFRQEGRWLEYMKDRAVIIVYNDSEWEGEMQLEVDWKKLGLGNPESLTATNYLHSTGFRVETALNEDGQEVEKAVFFNRPEEYAKIEDGKLLFPMTRFNYRMIVVDSHNSLAP